MKAYCSNCRFCKQYLFDATERCIKVVRIAEEDSPFSHTSTQIHARMDEDNKNNDCKYYEPKRLLDYIFTAG